MGARHIYFTPYDNAEQALIQIITSAKESVRVAVFTLTLESVVQALIAKKQSGVDIQVILDSSQSINDLYEQPKLKELVAANIPVVVGTSSKHNIMHLKVVIVDNAIVASGSYNFTRTAQLENNVLEIEYNRTKAQIYSKAWQTIHDWIVQNEAPIS